MAARAAWSGAITFAGFPIHVQAYNVLSSKKAASLKLLSPALKPVSQRYIDEDGWQGTTGECRRGVDAKGTIRPLDDDTVAAIGNAERSVMLEPSRFAPRDSVPLGFATGHFAVVPNSKIAGSEGPVGILWNGLRKTDRVLITEWVPRAGARMQLVALEATDDGLMAHTLPYKSDFASVPTHEFTEDAKAAAMFEQVVGSMYSTDPFSLDDYIDTYSLRRQEIIDRALAGEPVEAASVAQPAATPDLMAAMEAALTAAAGKEREPATA